MGIHPGVRLSYQQRGELVNRRLVPGVPHSLSWLQPRPVPACPLLTPISTQLMKCWNWPRRKTCLEHFLPTSPAHKHLFWVWAIFQVVLHDNKQAWCFFFFFFMTETLTGYFAKHN